MPLGTTTGEQPSPPTDVSVAAPDEPTSSTHRTGGRTGRARTHSTLTIDHLVWRMGAVNRAAHVIDLETGEPISYAELAVRSRAVAAALERFGARRGDDVITLAWNSPAHLAIMLGAGLAGVVVNALNPRLSRRALDDIVQRTPARIVFVDPSLLDPDDVLGRSVLPVVERAAANGASIVVLGAGAAALDFEAFLASAPHPSDRQRDAESLPVEEDCDYLVYYTGGTTGAPRPMRASQRAVMLHALSQSTVDALGLARADRVLPAAPLFHVGAWGIPFAALLIGSRLVMPGRDLKGPTLVDALVDYEVTVAAAVPTIWRDIVEALMEQGRTTPALREAITGGSSVPAWLVELIEEVTPARVASSWGMTETLACSTYERSTPADAAGRPIPLVEVRVVDEDGNPAATDGQLQVRGSFVIGAPDGSWMDTGDLARLLPGGSVAIRDRLKDLVKSGGEWIASLEVETALQTHPALTAVAVVGRPDPRWMERPVAFVVSDSDVDPAVLVEHLADQLPRFWIPTEYHRVAALPLTTVGKVDKVALREIAAAGSRPAQHSLTTPNEEARER